ncbi:MULTISPECIES: YqjF family protein [unclassified Nocardioides]|uniref:YqjF family protein n=1 Tax=unclassified Nocardioides TaxID=2615069 RepID=UPI003014E170
MNPQGPPLPTRQVMSQWWRDISFLHWRVDPDLVAPLLPAGTRPDVHDGSSWVGLIPFRMVDAALGRGRPVPRLGTFLETNVRLYSVDDAGRRGVVFRSLEADRLPVVAAARLGFGVPYQWARLRVDPVGLGPDPQGRTIAYRSRRRGRTGAGGRIDVEVGGPVAEPSPLDLFLTARFGLHTRVAGRTLWVPNSHGPWPLRSARAVVVEDTLVAAAGLPGLTDSPPDSVLFSSGVRTVFGLPQRV